MSLSTLFSAVLIGLSLPLPSEAGTQNAPVMRITGPTQNTHQSAPLITLRSRYDVIQDISLKLRSDSRLIADDVLIQRITSWAMTDAAGVRIHGIDVAPDHDLVIGYSGGQAEIVQVNASDADRDRSVIASFKTTAGDFVSPPLDALSARALDGTPLCISEAQPQQTVPMHFSLLLDRSLSMKPVLDQVKAMSAHFLTLLPPEAWCGVAPFNDSFAYTHPNFERCGTTDFGVETLNAFGGTDIYPLLKATYTNFADPFFDGRQKTIIIISDGYTLEDEARRQELIALKGDVLTFVYFIGGDHRNALTGITDQFVTHQGDIHTRLSRYFEVVGQAFSTQKHLHIRDCGDNQ